MVAPHYLDVPALAARWGVGERSVREYLYRSRRARKKLAGSRRTGTWDLPEPDKYYGRSPVWKVSTIQRWESKRPRQGERTDLDLTRSPTASTQS